MGHSEYFSTLSKYQRPELSEEEKSLLFKIMNDVDITNQLSSYLRFRNRGTEEIDRMAFPLVKLNLIEERKGRLLRGTRKYRLSTFGLFYILSETTSYPPGMLKKYQDNLIILTLLSPYFEIETITSSTARLYSVVTQYLRQCCKLTTYWLEDIGQSEEDRSKHLSELSDELGWNARILAYRISIMYSETKIHASNPKFEEDDANVTYYDMESRMKAKLSIDKKFMALLEDVKKGFDEGYNELRHLNDE